MFFLHILFIHVSVLVLPFLRPHVFLAIHTLPDSHKSSLYAWLLAEGKDTDKKIGEYCKTGLLVMFNVTQGRIFTACFCRFLFVFAPLHPLASSVALCCVHVHLHLVFFFLSFLAMPYFLSNYLTSLKVAELRFYTPNTHLCPLVGYSLA